MWRKMWCGNENSKIAVSAAAFSEMRGQKEAFQSTYGPQTQSLMHLLLKTGTSCSMLARTKVCLAWRGKVAAIKIIVFVSSISCRTAKMSSSTARSLVYLWSHLQTAI